MAPVRGMTPEERAYRERTEATLVAAGIEGARFHGGLEWRLAVEDLELILIVADELQFRASTVVVGNIQVLPSLPTLPARVSVAVGDRGTLEVSGYRYFDVAPAMMRPIVDSVVTAAKAIRRPAPAATWVDNRAAN